MTNKNYIDIAKRLNTRLAQNTAWRDLFRACSRVLEDLVERPKRDLETIRDSRRLHRGDSYVVEDSKGNKTEGIINMVRMRPDGVDEVFVQLPGGQGTFVTEVVNRKDRPTLIDSSRRHGLDFFSDTLSDADYQRIVDWVEFYWPEGSDNFARFIGFIKNMRLDSHQLWSKETGIAGDEGDFYPFLERKLPAMTPVWETLGDHYPTSHIELEYDAAETPEPIFADIISLFYLIAPIHLVLHRIVGGITGRAEIFGASAVQVRNIEQAIVPFKPDAAMAVYLSSAAQIRFIDHAIVRWPG